MTFLIALTLLFTQAQTAALRVVVLEGEDAVNIVQQKTAVRPLVEVRDRNNLPVPGASVTFAVGSGQPAAFGGAQTVTVTTNAAGQAAPASFSATGAGKVTIQVQAAHQGQIASAAITQTNFVTAAAAAAAGVAATAAGAAAGSTGGAGAAGAAGVTGAAGAGGGISATTIAIVGGAVAGGAVVAQQTGVIGSGGQVTYTGSLSGQYVWTTVATGGGEVPGTNAVCNTTRSVAGPMTIELNEEGTSGRATIRLTHTDLSISGFRCSLAGTPPTQHGVSEVNITGGPSALTFTATETGTGNATRSDRYTFTGSLSGNTITGSLSWQTQDQSTFPGGTTNGSGSITIPVTLQR